MLKVEYRTIPGKKSTTSIYSSTVCHTIRLFFSNLKTKFIDPVQKDKQMNVLVLQAWWFEINTQSSHWKKTNAIIKPSGGDRKIESIFAGLIARIMQSMNQEICYFNNGKQWVNSPQNWFHGTDIHTSTHIHIYTISKKKIKTK